MDKRDLTRYLILGVVAAVPLVGVGHIKPIPLAFVASLFTLHGLLSAPAAGRTRSALRDLLTAPLLLGCLALGGVFTFTALALRLWPPATADGHRVMAIGQTFVGAFVGIGVGLAIAFRGSFRHPRRDRPAERLIVHAVGALLIAVALVEGRWR